MNKPMARLQSLKPKFVDNMPKTKEHGILYISFKYELAIHLCACGCGNEAVTPISKGEWTITLHRGLNDNTTVSLQPSVGNRFECRSHYYITKNEVRWL